MTEENKTKKKVAKEATTTKTEPKKSVSSAAKVADNFAVIKTGGKQYLVEAGRYYEFEKLEGEEGATVNFSEVLLVVKGGDIKVGKPHVEGAKVTGKILSQFKADKVNVFKYKKRKRIRKTYGHRQQLTKVEITSIS